MKPWKPKIGEIYFWIFDCLTLPPTIMSTVRPGSVIRDEEWEEDYKLGNYFRTKTEALKMARAMLRVLRANKTA